MSTASNKTTDGEVYRRAFPTLTKPMVSYGMPFAAAARKHADEYGASRIYVIVSGTLSRTTNMLDELEAAFEGRVVGVRRGMRPHSLISECFEVLQEVRRTSADCIITLGGGSLSDAAKAVSFAAANDINSPQDFIAKLPYKMSPERKANQNTLPYILIPTTLSGGEYSAYAGVTDDADDCKYQLHHFQPADLVILAGEVAATTPLDVWISSGVRAIDHCCENMCSSLRGSRWDLVRPACLDGLRNLVPGLLYTCKNPADAKARCESQVGTMLSMYGLIYGIFPGASHGIGHNMGPMGVVHGKTSAVLMPAVHKYNAPVNGAAQAVVSSTFWAIPEAAALFHERGLSQDSADLGDLLDAIVRALDMPRSLKAVGIEGQDALEKMARNSMKDSCVVDSNPRVIDSPAQVMEILKACEV